MADMFAKIHNEPDLYGIICHSGCEENNALVEFADDLKCAGELDGERVLILKPDAFYSSKRMHNPPPAPDCLVLVKCAAAGHYALYLIELKDVNSTASLKHKEIARKFETMVGPFFGQFEAIFAGYAYTAIKFYLVSTYPKGGEGLSEAEYRKKILSCHLDTYASAKPLVLFGKAVLIEPKPSPLTLSAC